MSYHRGGNGHPRGFGFGGFQLMTKAERQAAIPPPPSAALSKQGYSTMSSITENALSATWGIPKKRSKTEDEYFEEEDETPKLDYIPAPGSPTAMLNNGQPSDTDEEDPLDAYMANIEKQVKKQAVPKPVQKPTAKEVLNKGIRDDIESEDVEESYYRYMEENPRAGLLDDDSDVEMEYDDDGNPIAPKKSKIIDPLPAIDHSTIKYDDFEKNFYIEHEGISSLSIDQVSELRQTLGIRVSGPNPPNPITSFGHFGFDEALMKAIRKCEYTQPTPIQAQAVPAGLSGRDIIGIAKTGSGKTAAFIWPLMVHIMDQKELAVGDGPIGLILAPTRELSQQIYTEARKFGKVYNINVVCAYGGGSKWEQSKALEEGAEIVVATPGRMIDLVKMKATNLQRVTFLVLDEADRMFDMGFEPQVRSICNHVRPDRQTLLFSATFKKKIKKLASDVLTDPVRIVHGEEGGEANEDVTQIVIVLQQTNKLPWLLAHLVDFQSTGSVLIFVTKKINAEELSAQLKLNETETLLFHGDMDQSERNRVITSFRKKEVDILVATDVAARGLDIPHIRTVINYDMAKDIDTHTHRIGRTGRAGEKGTAYSLVTTLDKDFAGSLVRNLEGAGQEVPQPLLELALQSAWFRKTRFKSGRGKALTDKAGLGFRERPGLGTATSSAIEPQKPLPPNIRPSLSISELMTKSSRGPAMDRLQAMKAAFRAQYQTQFTASEDHTWEQTLDNPEGAPRAAVKKGPLPEKKARRSRWDNP